MSGNKSLIVVPIFAIIFGAVATFYAENQYVSADEQNPVTSRIEFWQQAFAKPVAERIGPAPPELVNYIKSANLKYGFPEKPRTAIPSPDLILDVRAAFAEIPAPVRRLFDQKLAGIYFAEDLGSSGFAEEIYEGAKPVAGYIVLDASILRDRSANSWASWKENSPFMASPDFKLNATIEEASQDNRKQAIQYILLHELGHVLAIGTGINPGWNTEPKDVNTSSAYPFFQLSWTIPKIGNQYATRYDQDFPQRKNVVYYLGAKLPASQMIPTYEALERTNFATLYAATNPHDDFAESFVSYVHSVLMGKPLEITLSHDGKIEKVYKSCWNDERCAAKRKMLESLLKLGDPVNN